MINKNQWGLLPLCAIALSTAFSVHAETGTNTETNVEADASSFTLQADVRRISSDDLIQRKLLGNTIIPKIVNGTNINPSDAPNFVSVIINASNGGFLCGGTLLDARHVLTAAHCVSNGGGDNAPAGIVFALTSPNGSNNGALVYDESYSASAVIVHPSYANLINNDIAIIRLNTAVAGFSNANKTILNNATANLDNTTGTVIGMGTTSTGGDLSNSLQRVDLPIRRDAVCRNVYGFWRDTLVCAGYSDGTRKDSCQGDSGGPLNVNRNGQNAQAGIVSFGSAAGCAGGDPSGYTRVSSYIDFIKTHAPNAVVLGEESASPRISSVSGLWYDPNYSGSGFNATRPTANKLFMYHYGYTADGNGDTKWFYLEIDLDDNTVQVAKPYAAKAYTGFSGNGASFTQAPNSPPGIQDWGNATVTFNSCNSATAVLNGEDGQLSYNLVRLGFEFGNECQVN
ncbi:S1 family peptidase [Ostreibacterium oceani]|uniref:Trypsin-like serine protease n=1 Tax=Ostreibacterium oceani TaxID=2654998 RepID=A0A6N7EUE8_9GAMM|nr:serine protease [Ostreibacterium oceani]MPV85150.1 trypsin-like serine protease [Ostreibacterium oceani]